MKTSDLFVAALVVLAVACATAGLFFTTPKRAVLYSVEVPPASGVIAFDSFGPAHTCGSNSWAVAGKAHADWFIPAQSGRLSAIEVAIEPPTRPAGNATVFLASNRNGFPGAIVESFVVTPQMVNATSNPAPVVINSVSQPVLEAARKYWLCVRGQGGWLWRFNNQNIIQNSARETRREHWATAGDYCYICAFRVLLTTNQEPKPPAN